MNTQALTLGLALVLAHGAPAVAQERGEESLDRLLPTIRASHPGKLVDATYRADGDGRAHYHIRWITRDGVVLEFEMNTPNSGPAAK